MIQGLNPNRDKTFLSNPICTDWLWSPPNLPIEWMPGAICTGIKRPGREADYSPASTADVKNVWRYMSSPAIWLHTLYRDAFTYLKSYLHVQYMSVAYRRGGVWSVQTPPPRNSEVLTKLHLIANWAENVLCSYSNILISLKIAEFMTPAPQDIRKKGSKILKLPTFAIVLH